MRSARVKSRHTFSAAAANFCFLIVFAHIALDHAHGLRRSPAQSRSARRICGTPGGRSAWPLRMTSTRPTPSKRDGHQEDHRQPSAHGKAHDKGKDQHQRPADGHADDHHKGHLHVDHIGGHTGHQAGYRKLVDVLKGIILNAVKHVLAQVAGKACGRCGAGVACRDAEDQATRRP